MKKILSVLLATGMVLGSFAACSTNKNANESKKLSIVTTIFPEYDWVKEVLGEEKNNVDLTLLLDNGVDLHSFQPTSEDILNISTCDLFIYVGGESDEWVDDALSEATNKNMKVINLLDTLGENAKEEELIEGMEGEEEEECEEEEGPEYDEHVWLSLKNAQVFVSAIANALCEVDSEFADIYRANEASYIEKLSNLDSKYEEMIDSASCNILLFGDRFPFRYLVDDYGISYYAAFVGCSAETEASFETITFLSGKVDELKLNAVMVIESSDKRIAETIVQNTQDKNQQILVLDSMQSVTSKEVENGTDYLSIMESNLNVLADALK